MLVLRKLNVLCCYPGLGILTFEFVNNAIWICKWLCTNEWM